jgi:transmembrane sensor
MSETIQQGQIATSAKEINDRATFWLERREFGDWGEDDQTELDAWLAESKAHCATFWRLEAAWDRTHRLAALRLPKTEQIATARRPFWRNIIRGAAALAVISVLGVVGAIYSVHPQETTYSTPVGGREVITLADGSLVELNTDTILRARIDANYREVRLVQGEAYFEVTHDAKHPFSVMVADRRVTDLGTKFLIRSDPNRVEVSLLDGRVRFDSANSRTQTPSRVLVPGDVVVATADSMSVTKKPASQLVTSLAWRRGVLVFDNTPLADAVAELNRYASRKLVIADSATGKIEIGGTFPTSNVTAFTRVARELFGLRIENRGDETVISR